MMNLPLEGGCLCGAVRYRIDTAPVPGGYCHCRMCQRASAAPVVPWLNVTRAAFAWTRGEPAVYRSSAKAERLFCTSCGTQLAIRDIPDPGSLDVTVVSLDDPAAVRPRHHGWTTSRIPWFEIADDLPRHPEDPPGDSS